MLKDKMKFDFANHLPPETVLFLRDKQGITAKQFFSEVSTYITSIQQINTLSVTIYIPDDIYLFYTIFMATLYTNKQIILPAFLTDTNLDLLKQDQTTLISNKNFVQTNVPFIEITSLKQSEQSLPKSFNDSDIFFFTSGSTNTPKMIHKTLQSLIDEVKMHGKLQQKLIDLKPTIISTVVPYHIYGMLWRFLFPFWYGLTQDLDVITYPEEIQSKQQSYQKVAFISTPSFMSELSHYKDQYQFSQNCVAIFSSGSLLSKETSQAMLDIFHVSPYEIFGSTETGGVAYRQQSNGQKWHLLPDVKVQLNDQSCLIIDSKFTTKNPYQMSDKVDMINKDEFILKGRTDRLVKIAEKRISLPQMETHLEEFSGIQKAYICPMDDGKRIILGAVITLNQAGKEIIIKQGRHAFITAIKQHLKKWYENVVLPRKIRLIDRIPTNPQGKILKTEIQNLLLCNITEPLIYDISVKKEELSANLFFYQESSFFNGHFPNHPILPGVIQLHFVFQYIKEYLNITLTNYTITKLKFTNLILPNQFVQLHIQKCTENEFIFSYETGDKTCSTGKITGVTK